MTSTAPRAGEHPPGPKGIPVFGCIGELRRSPMRFSTRVAQTYGGIARIPLGRRHVYLVSEPALLHELLIVRRDQYMKNIRYTQAQELLGLGLLLSEGEEWKRQRTIAQPAFKPGYTYDQLPWMSELTARFLDDWAALAESGEAFDVEARFVRLAQMLAGHMILGPHFEEIAEEFCEHASAIKAAWPIAPRSLIGTFRPPPWLKLRRFRQAIKRLDEVTYEFLGARRRADFDDTGILTLLVRSSAAEGEPFTDRNLRDQIMTLFFAGHETSATGLCWIHYLLAKHPAVRERMEAEVRKVVGDGRPTARQVERLKYTEQVLSESLRLYSPIHAISRVAVEDNSIGGYPIAKGTTVVVSLFATHRLPQYWPDPERFDPDRFTPELVAQRPKFAFIPFAGGHRNCIGGSMAYIELKMIMAQVAQRYRLEPVPGHPVELEAGTTMYPRYGMKMTAHPAPAA